MLCALRNVLLMKWFVATVLGSLAASPAQAAPPWATLVPFRKVDADPNQSYELEEKHGPWLILAASFVGSASEEQSQELVLELRQKFRLEAYTFRRTYDFTKPTEGLGYNRYGGRRRMRYMTNSKFDEIAVPWATSRRSMTRGSTQRWKPSNMQDPYAWIPRSGRRRRSGWWVCERCTT
jgi:hypothetical protein